ncbi:MAG: hypothetical protein NZM25_09235 [Leptospiraceae bacterium]|nr:hypothetical protein [Leptospiraceae bacterium]MDW8307322.1 hypothetical protein [Leptospiraceae bacterium]
MKFLRKMIFLTSFIGGIFSSLYSIEDAFKAGKDLELQKAKELEATDKELDRQIKDLNVLLERYHVLKNIPVRYSPANTVFTKGEDYIELDSYNFIPMSFNNGTAVGTRLKKMRLYFSGQKLVKVVSLVYEENFYEKTKYISEVTDPSPTDDNTNDIAICTAFNSPSGSEIRAEGSKTDKTGGEQQQDWMVGGCTTLNKKYSYNVILEKMENTISNPLRINFKRDFYVPHLKYFEKMYRFTEEFQKRYGTNNDVVTIETLKRSLQY